MPGQVSGFRRGGGGAGERGEKTGTESRKRKPKAEACELRLAEVALPKGSGLATVRAKTCPKAGLSGAGGKTVAAPAAGIGERPRSIAGMKKGCTSQPPDLEARKTTFKSLINPAGSIGNTTGIRSTV